jgi:hypothetical protein
MISCHLPFVVLVRVSVQQHAGQNRPMDILYLSSAVNLYLCMYVSRHQKFMLRSGDVLAGFNSFVASATPLCTLLIANYGALIAMLRNSETKVSKH